MNQSESDPRVMQFIHRLGKLDAGERAHLKRNAGHSLEEARQDGLALFYSLLPPSVSEYQHATYFLVATLYPSVEDGGTGDLGAALRRARNDTNGKGLDRRVIALLDADESQLPHRLRQTLHFLQSNRVRVNWISLLDDLLAWNSPWRSVQRRWAHSYFAEAIPAGQATELNNNL
jgi:CRISPR system Cascade subunit CasB